MFASTALERNKKICSSHVSKEATDNQCRILIHMITYYTILESVLNFSQEIIVPSFLYCALQSLEGKSLLYNVRLMKGFERVMRYGLYKSKIYRRQGKMAAGKKTIFIKFQYLLFETS